MGRPRVRLLLMVENSEFGGILVRALTEYHVEWQADLERARDAFRRRDFAAVVLDLSGCCWERGLGLIREWRTAGVTAPIFTTSDRSQPSQAAQLLAAGADDYLRQPFHHDEFRLRLEKLLMRKSEAEGTRRAGGVILGRESFFFAGVEATPDLVLKFPDGGEERIRPKQLGILRTFAARAGCLVLKEELIRSVWGGDASRQGNSVNEYISILRRVFGRHGLDLNQWVVSEPKAGWRIHAAVGREPARCVA
jgi:two-component system OmpR family response regulator